MTLKHIRLHKCRKCGGWVWQTRPAIWSHIVWSPRYGDWINKGQKCASWPSPRERATPTKNTWSFTISVYP